MSEKSELYQSLKSRAVSFEKQYVQYTVEELRELEAQLDAGTQPRQQVAPTPAPRPAPTPSPAPRPAPPGVPRTLEDLGRVVQALRRSGALREGMAVRYGDKAIPVKDRPAERAGLSHAVPDGEPIRIDLEGRVWLLDEVPKPAIPRPRMTRKSRYVDTGVKTETSFLPDGRVDEVYEVSGDEHRELTVTTTLPSWQVGKYRDHRLPFAVHVYNDQRGFDRREVVRYFGGTDLVPRTVKTLYVGNQLCYQIASVRDTIETQYRNLQQKGY